MYYSIEIKKKDMQIKRICRYKHKNEYVMCFKSIEYTYVFGLHLN